MMLTEDDKAVLLLTTRVAASDAPSLPPTEWNKLGWALRDAEMAPADLFYRSPPESVDTEMTARIADLLDRGTGLALQLEDLENRGINAVTVMSERFPDRLRSRLGNICPPVIFVAGDLNLLEAGGLGIVGSRNVSEAGAEVARSAARLATEHGVPVVSGAARGVDQLAMVAAALSGGTVVGVVADSLQRRLREAEVREQVSAGNMTLATIQHPNAPFSPGSAMGRNKIIYALSDAVLVVASDVESGGTWAGADEALKKGLCPVFVWRGDGEGPGNEALGKRGAIEVKSVDDIFREWPPVVPDVAEQLTIL
ncbi:MAG: DNA-processing protein DprA [Acidimicrobiia bacterium]|nr:DNA-processing protein DprA [Acidimicrobiia bacterium]